jgi:hypothetical protein
VLVVQDAADLPPALRRVLAVLLLLLLLGDTTCKDYIGDGLGTIRLKCLKWVSMENHLNRKYQDGTGSTLGTGSTDEV